MLAELALLDHLLLLERDRTEAPAARVGVALHDAALNLGDDAVVAGGELDGGHLRNGKGNCLTCSVGWVSVRCEKEAKGSTDRPFVVIRTTSSFNEMSAS